MTDDDEMRQFTRTLFKTNEPAETDQSEPTEADFLRNLFRPFND